MVRVQLPAAAPISLTLRVSTQQSLQNSAYFGQHEGNVPIFGGRGRQVMRLPCKQDDVGALPTDSTISPRETRPRNRGRPHKPVQVGVTPTPATNFGEMIRLSDCKSDVIKPSRKRQLERYQHFPPSFALNRISRIVGSKRRMCASGSEPGQLSDS